jgi:hypothetical protein
MICFKDRTFCTESSCKNFGPCPRSLTEEVRAEGVKWWGGEDFPICLFHGKPKCYEQNVNHGSQNGNA